MFVNGMLAGGFYGPDLQNKYLTSLRRTLVQYCIMQQLIPAKLKIKNYLPGSV